MFIESPSFPQLLAYGATGGPRYHTTVTVSQSGSEQRNQAWARPRGVWEVGLVHRSRVETEALLAFFRGVAHGQLHGFRFRDFLPGEETGTAEPLGVGTGSATTYQLVKRYTAGSLTDDRRITKPIAGSVVVFVNGTPTDTFTVDVTTGRLTMTATLGAVLTASFRFEVPVRFANDHIEVRRVAPEVYSIESLQLIEITDFE